MKTSVVPAQITTVEDKIVGNLTFNQILMLVVSLVLGTTVYLLIPPISQLSVIKLAIIVPQFLIFGLLTLRIKGRTGADRLVIIIRYRLRPHLYVFTKNDCITRDIIPIDVIKKKIKSRKIEQNKGQIPAHLEFDQYLLDRLLSDPSLMIRVELGKKGGIDVSFNKDQL
ncbi:MAG: PrgI family protein [bacterium]